MKNTTLLIISSLISYFLIGCVSVNIGKTKAIKSEQMNFKSPQSHFQKVSTKEFDFAWRNESTGNTIAVLSECQNNSNANLAQLTQSTLTALNDLKILTEKDLQYNERAALETTATGFIDGIAVHMRTLVFQKNACDYTISYFGIEKNFNRNVQDFELFQKDFKIRSEAK